MHDLDTLRADLITRWTRAFDRVAEVMREPVDAVDTVYTVYPAFPLENFTATKFKPGARLSRTPSKDGDDYKFRLDARGRPLQVRFSHTVNGFDWQGIYLYGTHDVEYIEVCLQTGVPSVYNRLALKDGLVVSEQRFLVNGGAGALSSRTSPDLPRRILDTPEAYALYLVQYDVQRGITVAAVEHHEVGGETHRPTLTYEYDAAGSLQRIVQHWPDETRTLFAAKTKTTTKSLAEDLSARIATAVLTRLATLPSTPRLQALELSYREHDSPIPMLVPLTEADQVDSLALSANVAGGRWLKLDDESFAPAITEFTARAEASDNGAVGKMLRAAALRITKKARAELPVAPTFVAFAIDWELEGDELAKILKQCGADANQLKAWRKLGWL